MSLPSNLTGNIYLTGMMGSGKSTLGSLLADLLSWRFIDLDAYLENKLGVSISTVFDIEKEAGFRLRETAVLKEVSGLTQCVVATGGGTVLSLENQEIMSSSGKTIYLHVSLEELYKRLDFDKKRPLLQVSDRRPVIKSLFHDRHPLYESSADLVFKSACLNPKREVLELKKAIECMH